MYAEGNKSNPIQSNPDTNSNVGQTSEMDDDDNSNELVDNFVTSTPVKRKFKCEDCENKMQCVDCYVRQENPEFFP